MIICDHRCGNFEAMKEIKVNGMLGVHCENGDLVDELIQSYVSQES